MIAKGATLCSFCGMQIDTLFRIAGCLAAIAVVSLFSGCTTLSEEDSKLPWAQPAPWEGSIPGMPSTSGY